MPKDNLRPGIPLGDIDQVLKEIFRMWGIDQETIDKTEMKPSFESPAFLSMKDEDVLKEIANNEDNKKKFGEYSLNPKALGINAESIRPEKIRSSTSKDLSFEDKTGKRHEFTGGPCWKLQKYLIEEFLPAHSQYTLPDLEYFQFVVDPENKIKLPDSHPLKDGGWHYFFGSTLRSPGGRLGIPYVRWYDPEFVGSALWLDRDWSELERVVLLEE